MHSPVVAQKQAVEGATALKPWSVAEKGARAGIHHCRWTSHLLMALACADTLRHRSFTALFTARSHRHGASDASIRHLQSTIAGLRNSEIELIRLTLQFLLVTVLLHLLAAYFLVCLLLHMNNIVFFTVISMILTELHPSCIGLHSPAIANRMMMVQAAPKLQDDLRSMKQPFLCKKPPELIHIRAHLKYFVHSKAAHNSHFLAHNFASKIGNSALYWKLYHFVQAGIAATMKVHNQIQNAL